MRLYLCGQSALSMIRYLRKINDDRLFEPPARVRSMTKPVYGSRLFKGISHRAELIIGHAGDVVHALVAKKAQVVSRGGLETHLWSWPVPAGSFLKLEDDLYVSSPAFTFLQMARELDEVELAKLGMELCGFYALPEKHTPFVSKGSDETLYELRAVTMARRIKALCDSADNGVIGVRKARMVANWLVDGSASPRETATYLLLCLPKRKGGYGLPKPLLNPTVTVSTTQGEETRLPDLYWKDRSIDIEYQSDLSHGGDWNHYRDSKRQVMLTVNKITVLMLTNTQLSNADDFHELAIGLHRLLGVRVQRINAAWKTRRDALRDNLLKG